MTKATLQLRIGAISTSTACGDDLVLPGQDMGVRVGSGRGLCQVYNAQGSDQFLALKGSLTANGPVPAGLVKP